MNVSTIIELKGTGGEFTHDLSYKVDGVSVQQLQEAIRFALQGYQNTRELILYLPYATVIIPAKILHHSVINLITNK
jgi:hypothetical protein